MTTSQAYLSDVVIVAEDLPEDPDLADLATELRDQGVTVRHILPDLGVIEGTLPHELARTIDDHPHVRYVRTVFSYIARHADGPPTGLGEEMNARR